MVGCCHNLFCFCLLAEQKVEAAIGVYWVTDGIDRCLVGFLPRHCVKHAKYYDGRAAQIVELYHGSESPAKRKECSRYHGVCMAAFLQNK